ncbi:hypothetical protein BN14_10906 [Rhizoctonia solani AG-1 IB]|uniref:Uncharacterized protein n=1 Tax=Thanatephorus cucumeris (strain AG1-IB / isolate 7/3/14) TaxID=1108050 RepID=M5CGV2_THACB|nr:hypothetical protein BN14_10906 [Rhizoctonia solani AG-1 IB]
MSPEPTEPNHDENKKLSLAALADAADALAKAAATLATAARAATEAFSVQAAPTPETHEDQGINLGKGLDIRETEITNLVDTNQRPNVDAAASADNKDVASSKSKLDPPATSIDAPKRNSRPLAQPYRLLVDNESDVFLFVCALIDKRQRVVCYMPCGTNPLKAYKQLASRAQDSSSQFGTDFLLKIESVTESPVYILTSTTAPKQDQVVTEFCKNHGSVLLVPESLSPELEISGENSWVVHVGWPVSETQYNTQRKNHQAQNNVLVAYSGDQSLYPSGDHIVDMTEPWPKDGASFRASVAILRPLYEVILTEISLDMKTRVYQDWIQFHAIHGPRHVKSWTSTMVVERANSYLLKVLQWSGPHTGGDDVPLPEVSPGFVTQNELQAAVQDGVLQVENDSDPDVPSPSPAPRPPSTLEKAEFQLVPGHTYFALDEEFDAIPSMCFVACKYFKTICFLEGHAALKYYQKLASLLLVDCFLLKP